MLSLKLRAGKGYGKGSESVWGGLSSLWTVQIGAIVLWVHAAVWDRGGFGANHDLEFVIPAQQSNFSEMGFTSVLPHG